MTPWDGSGTAVLEELGQGARVEDVRRRGSAPAGGRDGELHVPEPARRVGVGGADDRNACFDREAHVRVAQVEPVREAVHLDRLPFLERDLERALEVKRVLPAM